jgi:hypothetical protein
MATADESVADPDVVLLKVNVRKSTIEALREIAARQGTTMTQALADSIEMNKFLLDQEAQQKKVLLEGRNGAFERVVRP